MGQNRLSVNWYIFAMHFLLSYYNSKMLEWQGPLNPWTAVLFCEQNRPFGMNKDGMIWQQGMDAFLLDALCYLSSGIQLI